MRLLGPLIRNVALALALVAFLDWWLGASSMQLTSDQVQVLGLAFVLGWGFELVLVGLALAALTLPLR